MGPGMHHAQREGWRDMRINESTDKRIRQQGQLRMPALQIQRLKNSNFKLARTNHDTAFRLQIDRSNNGVIWQFSGGALC